MLPKFLVLLVFVGILVALGTGFVHLMREKGNSDKTVRALSVRVALSVALFGLLYVLAYLGVIEPNAVGPLRAS